MIPTIITPDNREHWLALRKKNINSTEVSALFGISPYVTIYELYHQKANNICIEFEETDRMRFGSIMEPVIAQEIARQQGWSVSPLKCYMQIDELRIGSSFDFSIDDMIIDGQSGILYKGLLEIKNVDKFVFLDEWKKNDKGEYEAPLHIELQAQHELLVSDRKFVFICALVGGNEFILIKRDRDERVISAIKEKIAWFWQCVSDKKEPEPDFARDAKFISKLYGYAEPEKTMDGTDAIKELAMEYKEISEKIKPLEEAKETLKAKILIAISDAEEVKGDGYNISAGMVGECPISFTRKAFRNFKVTFPKPKEKK